VFDKAAAGVSRNLSVPACTMRDMGQNNRQRRAAKHRLRARDQQRRTTRETFAAGPVDDQVYAAGAAAVDEHFSFCVDRLIQGGWTPLDLYEVVHRKTTSPAITHLLHVVAVATARHPVSMVDPQWRAQLDGLGATAEQTGGVSPSWDWGHRSGLAWPSALAQLRAVLVVVWALPTVERVLPAPGSRSENGSSADGLDGRVLRRVRALLAKAESSEHLEEAEALTAKAQELMTRYSIERAVAESTQPTTRGPSCRRLWPDSPYAGAKALLILVVAKANNCRAVQSSTWGFVTVVGYALDLNVVELLTTSLLVQGTRAMAQAGPQVTRTGRSSTRSFRQSFLVAYAGRIGERLSESAHTTETTFDADHGGQLVPVLAARHQAVQDKVTALFPELIERHIPASHADGWRAGRAAADRADFNVHDSLRSRAG
jgi:Protein of unknown function (DUF2786)